jgi:hypothetical protein
MKFKTADGGEIEISNITSVLEKTIEETNGRYDDVGYAFIWIRHTMKAGSEFRWCKYPYGWANDTDHILGGVSHDDMLYAIRHFSRAVGSRVWFSGAVCNIEHNKTLILKNRKRMNPMVAMMKMVETSFKHLVKTGFVKLAKHPSERKSNKKSKNSL